MKKKPSKKSAIDPEFREFLRKEDTAIKVQRWEIIGRAGMDTACLLISDPCYSLPYAEGSQEKDLEIRNRKEVYDTMKSGDKDTHYGQVRYRMGHVGAGVVVHSPHGDGEATIYGLLDGLNRVRAVYFSFDGKKPHHQTL